MPKENVFDYTDAMLEAAIDQAVTAERERCLNLIRIALDTGEYECLLAASLIRIIKQ